jgi:stage 0 sporulation protein B (sporulation initiation phosphotransferase)
MDQRIGEVGMNSNRLHDEEYFGKQTEDECVLLDGPGEANHNLRLIHLFNHYRHDWMNEIQLLYGYVKLKKYDKLEALMENIKTKVQHESYISKLGIPELVVYIFSSQTGEKELKLEVEMDQEIHLNELPVAGKIFSRLLMDIINAFKKAAKQCEDSGHGLRVKLAQTSDMLQVDCAYEGELTGEQLLPGLERVMLQMGANMTWKTNQRDGDLIGLSVEVPLNI